MRVGSGAVAGPRGGMVRGRFRDDLRATGTCRDAADAGFVAVRARRAAELAGVLWYRSAGVREYRITGVQEYRRIEAFVITSNDQ